MSEVHCLDPDGPAIFGCAQAGCRVCQDTLVRRHEGLVHCILRRQAAGGLAYAELVQEGRIALWRAVLGFDPGRGVAFSTYAGTAIERRIWQVVARARRHGQRPRGGLSVGQTDRLEAVGEAWHRARVHAALLEAVAHLPDRLQVILVAHYGLHGQTPCTWQTIGQQLGVTKARVGQLHQDALVLLRLPVFSARLRRLCGQDSRAAYVRTMALSRTWQQRKRGRNR
ncbi:MAG: sigma-70 family RNA polymerase sigma factor [Chloroflexota bacterium]|nr:MAG: sigma-70 family RNA polymerase sigma factor [Chloroflexota bacterium]